MSKLNLNNLPAEILVPVQFHEKGKGFPIPAVASVPICHHYTRYENLNALMAGEICPACHKYVATEKQILDTIRIKR